MSGAGTNITKITMTKPQEIQKKIRETLKLGCNTCDNGYVPLGEHPNGEIEWGGCNSCVVDGTYIPYEPELHLEHVLQALQKSDEDYPIHLDFFFNEDDEIELVQAKGNPVINRKATYNLSLSFEENLENEELCEFLYKLLTK